MRFARILCPVDFSEASYEAMLAAADLARAFDSLLMLVNVYQLPVPIVPRMALDPLFVGAIMKDADENLARLAREATQLGARRVESSRLEGVPWDAIVKLARDGHADVVVMGTHGRTGLRHALLGSVAERVIRHAPCPVLVIRPSSLARAK